MIRSALRAVGYVATELLPFQAIRCCLDRDYADAMYDAAAKHDGAEQLNEREAEVDVSEGRPPGFYTMMTPVFATKTYGFPPPVGTGHQHVASDGGIWVFNNLGAGEWDATNYPPTGDPYQEVKQRERAAAQSSADGSAQGPAERPAEGEVSLADAPSAGHLTVDWLTPAICEVLAEHIPSKDHTGIYCNDSSLDGPHAFCEDWQAWREHIGPNMAVHILKALAAQPK